MQKIAQVLKSNGTDGELLISFFDVYPEDIDLQEPVFINFDGLPVPFFFESFTPRGTNRALVRLTGVHNLKDADELAGSAVYADYFEEEDGEDLTGWSVINAAGGAKIGPIVGYEDIPGNLCVYVDAAQGQVLLPLHQDLVVNMDHEKREITLTIPEGLL
jgi:16S rRNA processing protein RimM